MKTKKVGIARLLEISGTKRLLLAISILSACLHSIFTMVPYALILFILQQLLQPVADFSVIQDYLLYAAIAIVVSFFLMFLSGVASHLAAFNILYDIRISIINKLGQLPMGYLSNRSSGELKKILSDDVERIESFVAHAIPDLAKAICLPLVTLIYLYTLDWRLATISLIPMILLTIIVSITMNDPQTKTGMKQYHQSLEDMNSGIVEFVRAMPVMKIFGQTASAFKKYSSSVRIFLNFVSKWVKLTAGSWGIIMSFLTNALLPILILGLYLYFSKNLSLAVFILFLILGVGYIKPLFALSTLGAQMMMIIQGVNRIDDILFDAENQTEGTEYLSENFSIVFQDVSFEYKEGFPVLTNIQLSLPQGSITALVGPSGSGKSTLAQLIPRFYDPIGGNITIGNLDIRTLQHQNLLEHVSVVFQDNMMFYDTIYNNILMGMDYSEEDVIRAAKIARCHEFIQALPDGYQTHFGDKGVHLSGGEQQRIQLARVVLKDAPILILDEATAFSDPENEQLIMEAFQDIIVDKTVLVIAHRLSTITECDQIVVMNQGKIDAIGTHPTLLDQSALYNNMWQAHKRAKSFEL